MVYEEEEKKLDNVLYSGRKDMIIHCHQTINHVYVLQGHFEYKDKFSARIFPRAQLSMAIKSNDVYPFQNSLTDSNLRSSNMV